MFWVMFSQDITDSFGILNPENYMNELIRPREMWIGYKKMVEVQHYALDLYAMVTIALERKATLSAPLSPGLQVRM